MERTHRVGRASAGIKVTLAMIEAGVDELLLYDGDHDRPEFRVCAIYEAMLRAKSLPDPQSQ